MTCEHSWKRVTLEPIGNLEERFPQAFLEGDEVKAVDIIWECTSCGKRRAAIEVVIRYFFTPRLALEGPK